MNGKNHSQLIKIFLNWYTFYQFWFKLRKEVVIKMAEAQFDLCFSSDWESDGSYKDPPYLPEKDDVSSSSDSDSEEIQFKEKGVSVMCSSSTLHLRCLGIRLKWWWCQYSICHMGLGTIILSWCPLHPISSISRIIFLLVIKKKILSKSMIV